MTEAHICICKFELSDWDTEQQYSHGNKELSMAGYVEVEQVYRWCWLLSCGMDRAGNVRIWQKLLHVYLHWEQSFLGLQRATFGDYAPALYLPLWEDPEAVPFWNSHLATKCYGLLIQFTPLPFIYRHHHGHYYKDTPVNKCYIYWHEVKKQHHGA